MLKQTFVTIVLWAAAAVVHADHVVNLVSTDARTLSYRLDNLDNITFSGTNVVVNMTNGLSATFAFADIDYITFGEGIATAIDTPRQAIRVVDSLVNHSDETQTLSIYNTSGALLRQQRLSKGQQADLSYLPKGLYVARLGQQTVKFSR